MDLGLIIFFFIVVGIPVLAGTSFKMFRQWLKHKEAMALAVNQQTAEKAAQYAAHTERLEQRVRVLERILTDQSHGLAEQIEGLRNEPLN